MPLLRPSAASGGRQTGDGCRKTGDRSPGLRSPPLPRWTCASPFEGSHVAAGDYEGGNWSRANEGWEAADAKPGTKGRVFVFAYEAEWEGRFLGVEEVTVYHKMVGDDVAPLTAKARYGKDFPRR